MGRTRKDSEQQQQRSSSPIGSTIAPSEAYGEEGRLRVISGSLSRPPTVIGGGGGGGRAHRRLAFPVSGPASSTYAPPPTSIAGRAGRRFVSTSTRPESIADGADTLRADGTDGAPGEDDSVLDFASLRTAHTAFLAFVQDGLLLSSPVASSLVRSILDVCERFAGSVERWGGDVLPPLLETSADTADRNAAIEDRQQLVDAVTAELDSALGRFFKLLASSSSSSAYGANVSSANGDESGLGSLSMSVAQLNLSRDARGDASATGTGAARKHLEQLLLRLDYSGFFAERVQRERAQLKASLDVALA